MEALEFYDVKAKKKFKTSDYKVEVKNGRKFAKAVSPLTGINASRIIGIA